MGPSDCMWPIHESKSAGDTDRTWNAIRACWIPQYSAHCPGKSPVLSAFHQSRVSRPGNTSRFPENRGGQKLWTTSPELISSSTVRPAGMYISFAVVTPASG